MLRRLVTAAALTMVPVLGLSVPASAATTAPAARMHVQTLPPCPAGYAEWYITNGTNNYYLDAEGLGAAVEVTNTPTCWHAPANGYGEFTDNSGNCLDWDQNLGEVIMATCNSKVLSEQWDPGLAINGGLPFTNYYAFYHSLHNQRLAAEMFAYGAIVSLSNGNTGLDTWYR